MFTVFNIKETLKESDFKVDRFQHPEIVKLAFHVEMQKFLVLMVSY